MGDYAYLLANMVAGLANLISFLLFIYIIFSLLISFNVINTYNQFVSIIYGSLYKLFEPMLRPIRNIMPDLGGLDLSPIVIWFLLQYGTPFITTAIRGLA
ncbi:MAG: YggT family protein [Alphaproteobacteria bacterium]|jgi:YggT family protein|nr:YggT family protein [Alphaproteobacteria bacterium]HPF47685.1 YggT family protein [Emcibacteraceae bacterium]